MITIFLILLLFTYSALGITPPSRGTLILEPSVSYLALDVALQNKTGQVLTDGSKTYILSRRYANSTENIFVTRDNSDPDRAITQRVTVNKRKSVFFFNGFSVKGFLQSGGDVTHVVVLEDISNDIYILTVDSKYTIKEKKKIPKSVILNNNVQVKSWNFEEVYGTTLGKRILIGGTAVNSTHSWIFFALFNTYYNITEMIQEEPFSAKEVLRAMEFDNKNNQFIIISDIYSDNPIEISCNDPKAYSTVSWNIGIRSFSLKRQVLEWSRIVGHTVINDSYAASGIRDNNLIIFYNVNKSHQTNPSKGVTDVEIAVLRADTGEGEGMNACHQVIASTTGSVVALDAVVTYDYGIYLLADVEAGVLKYPYQSNVVDPPDIMKYEVTTKSLAIFLFTISPGAIPTNPTLTMLDASFYIKTSPVISRYPPVRIFATYPSGISEKGIPDLLLAAPLKSDDRIGIIFYGFSPLSVAAGDTKNPFVRKLTDQCDAGSNCSRCFENSKSYCLNCIADNTLYNHACCIVSCLAGSYVNEVSLRRSCHYTCNECSGPHIDQCMACDSSRTLDSTSGRCKCNSGFAYTSGAKCDSQCLSGQAAVMSDTYARDTTCMNKCPEHSFFYVDYAGGSLGNPATTALGVDQGNSFLEFFNADGCLVLPGPTDITQIPNQYTFSFWLKGNFGWTDGAYLAWVFNAFWITYKAAGQTLELVLNLGNGNTPKLTAVTIPAPPTLALTGWNYIAISVRQQQSTIYAYAYLVSSANLADTGGKIAEQTFTGTNSASFASTMLVGCKGDIISGSVVPSSKIQFTGYIRELTFMKRFHGTLSIAANRLRSYPNCLQIYSDVLSYWRFDSYTQSSDLTTFTLQDSSKYQQKVVLQMTSNPRPSSSTGTLPLPLNKYDNRGECIDFFSDLNGFPKYSLSPIDYAYTSLEYRFNLYELNHPGVLKNIIDSQDMMMFYRGGCKYGTLVQSVPVTVTSDGKMYLARNKPLPQSVYGTHVDVCYYSALLSKVVKLGQVYFPLMPETITPANGFTDKAEPSEITFSLDEGDQAIGDIITLVNMEADVMSTLTQGVMVNEASGNYLKYTIAKLATGTYSSMSSDPMDTGTYVLAWRPNYMRYQSEGGLIQYKNLYTNWRVQNTPQIKFPYMVQMPDTLNNKIKFKGELFYIDLVGPGQADGDQVLFCNTGCHYNNRRGFEFTRVNGKYPPIWLGDTIGVTGLTDNLQLIYLYVCWRPAARASKILASDDTWNSVRELSVKADRAVIMIEDLSVDTKELPEIDATNPPYSDPVLYSGQNIWFRISKCSDLQMKPSSSGSTTPGKVEIVQVDYDTNLLTVKYTSIWSETFPNKADKSSTGFTVGKLQGDPLTCKYTITDLPQDKFKPGYKYRLIIYSNSFMSPVKPLFLLGTLSDGIAQYQFEFTYEEAKINTTVQYISPSEDTLTIYGKNLGDVTVQGLNGFSETRRLFAANISLRADPECDIKGSYLVNNLYEDNPQSITLKNLPLSDCIGNIYLQMKLIKIADNDAAPRWFYTSIEKETLIATIGCHPSCQTCDGTSSTDCLTCNGTSTFPFLYKGECLQQCKEDLPFGLLVFLQGTFTFSYYQCVKTCPEGYFKDTAFNLCLVCNDQCKACTGDGPRQCTSCKGIPFTDNEDSTNDVYKYYEKYFYRGMCMLSCPAIYNDLNAGWGSQVNIINTDNYTHMCSESGLPNSTHPIGVLIQSPPYAQKVNIKRNMNLRAIIYDSTNNLSSITWFSYPKENFSKANFYTSDERIFTTYDDNNLAKEITSINMNSFNYKGENNEMRIGVKVKTSDSFGFDFIELFGNRPPELKETSVTIVQGSSLKTQTYITINIKDIQDSDDYYEMLYFKVILKPRSLAIPPNTKTSVSASALLLLAQLPDRTITIMSRRLVPAVNKVVNLTNVYIPTLIFGPQEITEGVKSSVVTCDMFIICEDRYKGVSKAKLSYNITETFTETTMNNSIGILKDSILNTPVENMTWDQAMSLANTLAIVAPSPTTYFMNYASCTKDADCSLHGTCRIVAGFAQCICDDEYTGEQCTFQTKYMNTIIAMTTKAIMYLKHELLEEDTGEKMDDVDLVDQIATALIGILKSPEALSENYLEIATNLCEYMTRIDNSMGIRLEDTDKEDVLKAIDAVMNYLYVRLRDNMRELYKLKSETANGPSYAALYAESRARYSELTMRVRNGLYRFLNAISSAQYPTDTALYKKYTTFELLLTSERESDMFSSLGDTLAIEIPGSSGFVKIPSNFLDSVRDKIPYNTEFKIRLVKWVENPYIFSEYQSEIISSVMSMAILDSNGNEVRLNLTEPIVFFLPKSNMTKNFPENEKILCKYFNDSKRVNVTIRTTARIDVNLLNMSDEEKRRIYPEWNPKLYTRSHFIVDDFTYTTTEQNYPEFEDSDGISGYGNLIPSSGISEFIPCAAFHLSEIAAVIEYKFSLTKVRKITAFYHNFDPLNYWQNTLGFYCCIGMVSIFVLAYASCWIADRILIPELERLIELHRLEYNDKEGQKAIAGDDDFHDLENPGNDQLKKKKGKKGAEGEGEGGQEGEEKGDDDVSVKGKGEKGTKKKKGKTKKKGKKGEGGDKPKAGDEESKEKEEKGEVTPGGGKGVGSPGADEVATLENPGKKKSTSIPIERDDILPEISQPRNFIISNESINTTQHNATTTQDLTTSGMANKSNLSQVKLHMEDANSPEKLTHEIGGIELRRQAGENHPIEDIFSEEHKLKRDQFCFSLKNCLLQGNLFTNTILRTNVTFPRVTRCIMLFLNIYFQMFWCAVFIAGETDPLDRPEDDRYVSQMVTDQLWIPFTSPIFTMILLYLFGGLFKVSDNRVLRMKSFKKYQALLRELSREMRLRKIMAYLITVSSILGINFYLCRFSANYGWKISSVWFWSFILGMVIDSALYDTIMACIQSWLYNKVSVTLSQLLYAVRSLKQAGLQE